MSTPRGTIAGRCLAFLIVFIAVASSVGTFIGFRQAKKFYGELNATRLDPLGLRRFEIPAAPQNPTLIFFGDSRAAQWSEPSWLGGQTLNLGIGAQTSAQILGRFDQHLAPFSPRIVVLQAGINDLKAIPHFPQSEGEIINNCKQNIERIVARCREKKAHVVLTTIFPIGDLPFRRRLFWSDRVDLAIETVNSYIHSLKAADVSILDTADILNGKDGRLVSEYSRDFLHLSDEGVAKLNLALRELVEPALR